VPNFISFVVIQIDGNPELVRRQFKVFSDVFPGPGYGGFFKIIAEGKITEHFEKCMVSGSSAHRFNIRCANAFLTGCNPVELRPGRSGEKRLEGHHTRRCPKNTGVVQGNQGGAWQSFMSLAFKKL
jgi:hypothetical protein